MSRLFAILLVAAGLLSAAASAQAQVIINADTDITIEEVGPFETTSGELSTLLERSILQATRRSELTGTGAKLSITLKVDATYWHELPKDAVTQPGDIDGFSITIKPRSVLIHGRTPLAAGFGVMQFVEEHLHLIYAWPGELGVCLPAETSFTLPEGHREYAPWAVSRALSGLKGEREREKTEGAMLQYRNFFLLEPYFKSLRFHAGAVHHAMARLFPLEECARDCPEVLPILEDGSRMTTATGSAKTDRRNRRTRDEREDGKTERKKKKDGFSAWHPCYSNPVTRKRAVAEGRRQFTEGRIFFSLGVNDGRKIQCHCETCTEQGWPNSYYNFVNAVADDLREEFPHGFVGVLAYGDVGIPPADLTLRENVIVNVAGERKKIWEGIAPALGAYEYLYGQGFIIPNSPLALMQNNAKYFRKNHLIMHYAELYPVWAFDALKVYVHTRLLWDADADLGQLVDTWCSATFGKGGEAMSRYYMLLSDLRNEFVPGEHSTVWNKVWPFKDPLQFHRCPTDLHPKLRECLADAGRAELTDPQRRRLEMIEAFTEFSAVYYEMVALSQAVFAGEQIEKKTLTTIQQLTERKEAVFALFEKHPEWFAGSACDYAKFEDRGWRLNQVEDGLATARATVGTRLAGKSGTGSSVSLSPFRKSNENRFKPAHFQLMDTTGGRGGALGFSTVSNVSITEDEDPRHAGRPKAQWMIAKGPELTTEDRQQMTLSLEGASGTVLVLVEGKMRSDDRTKLVLARMVIAFEEKASEKRTIVLEVPEALRENADSVKLEFTAIWKPEEADSELSGSLSVTSLD
jgi:hypothetical protein